MQLVVVFICLSDGAISPDFYFYFLLMYSLFSLSDIFF